MNEKRTIGAVGKLSALTIALVVFVSMSAAASVSEDAPERPPESALDDPEVVVVTPEERSDTMTAHEEVPLLGDGGGPGSDGSTCGGFGTGSCTGATWVAHCCSLEFDTMVFFGTFGTTENRVTVVASDFGTTGNTWVNTCDWFGAFGLCVFEQNGNIFIDDTIEHTGQADLSVCAICDWSVTVQNV